MNLPYLLSGMERTVLQVALDLVDLPRAVQIARESVDGGADWIEAGTPLVKSEGMHAVSCLRDAFPGREIVADMKIADAGATEVEMAAKSGATLVTILGSADDSVISDAVRSARTYGIRVMADLITVGDPVTRSKELEKLGVAIIIAHVGIDQQMAGKDPLALLQSISGSVGVPIAAAGGLNEETAALAAEAGASVVIVGSAITRAADVSAATARIRSSFGRIQAVSRRPGANDAGWLRESLISLSTPNISDAMHRQGAMHGLIPLCGDLKMAGPAVTVRTISGDWAKPVEAIDRAEPGDVIVIDNGGAVDIAPWGELATMSCMKRGVAGVVVYGAVRDVDDIRMIGIPVFSTGIVPNAGDPKGFGEINVEIRCAGQSVRPGDYIVGDASGVVVIPKERVREVARRALEVRRSEDRIREEISRGSTLSVVSDLLRWEKRQ